MRKNSNKNEELLKEAIIQTSDEFTDNVTMPAQDIEFSASHKEKMNKLFKIAAKKERNAKLSRGLKIAVCFIVAAIVSGAAVLGGVTAWKRISVEYHFDPKNPGTAIEFSDGKPSTYMAEFLYIKYVPPRFVCTDKKSDENVEFVRFEGEVGEWFELCVYITGTPEKNADESVNQYIWNNGKYDISLMGNIEQKELEKIAGKANVYR